MDSLKPRHPEQAFLNTVLSTCPTCYNHLSSHNGLTSYLGERLELFGDKPDHALLCGLLKSTAGPRHSGGTGHGPGRKGSTDTSSFSVVHFSFLPVPTGRRGKPFLSGYPRQRSKVGHKGRIPQGGRRADLPPPEAVCAGCLLSLRATVPHSEYLPLVFHVFQSEPRLSTDRTQQHAC